MLCEIIQRAFNLSLVTQKEYEDFIGVSDYHFTKKYISETVASTQSNTSSYSDSVLIFRKWKFTWSHMSFSIDIQTTSCRVKILSCAS